MQVSLNPLIGCVVKGDKLASTLTFGQFVKAIASFIAPILASWLAVRFDNWMLLYPIFGAITIIAACYLGFSKIDEEMSAGKGSSFMDCLKMLGDPAVLLLFLGIVAHVGIDVGINTSAPKIIIERLGLPLSEAALATSVYFFFRTLGCLTGSYILAKWQTSKFFAVSVAMMVLSMAGLFVCKSLVGIYVAIALVGYGNSNIFPMIFSKALLSRPDKDNEMSGLMIMLHKKIDFGNRLLIQDAFNLNSLSGLVRFVKRVVRGTFIIEGIGALLYMTVFVPQFGTVLSVIEEYSSTSRLKKRKNLFFWQ